MRFCIAFVRSIVAATSCNIFMSCDVDVERGACVLTWISWSLGLEFEALGCALYLLGGPRGIASDCHCPRDGWRLVHSMDLGWQCRLIGFNYL